MVHLKLPFATCMSVERHHLEVICPYPHQQDFQSLKVERLPLEISLTDEQCVLALSIMKFDGSRNTDVSLLDGLNREQEMATSHPCVLWNSLKIPSTSCSLEDTLQSLLVNLP